HLSNFPGHHVQRLAALIVQIDIVGQCGIAPSAEKNHQAHSGENDPADTDCHEQFDQGSAGTAGPMARSGYSICAVHIVIRAFSSSGGVSCSPTSNSNRG